MSALLSVSLPISPSAIVRAVARDLCSQPVVVCVCGVGRFAQSVSGSTRLCMLRLCNRRHQDVVHAVNRGEAVSLSPRPLSVSLSVGLCRSWTPECGGRRVSTTGWSFPRRRRTFSEPESGCSSGPQRNSSSSTSSTASAAGEELGQSQLGLSPPSSPSDLCLLPPQAMAS